MEAIIRPATTADLFWLRLLLGEITDEIGGDAYPIVTPRHLEAITASWAARLGGNDPTFLALVAEHDKVVGGFVIADLGTRMAAPSPFLFVPYLYVVPLWRESAVGRMLSAFVIEEGQKRGAKAVEFFSRPDDPQWTNRGWPVAAVIHALPVEAALASIVPTRTPNGHGHLDDAKD